MTNKQTDKHTTHHACKEVADKHGDKAKCCRCIRHKCKKTKNSVSFGVKNMKGSMIMANGESYYPQSVIDQALKQRDEEMMRKQFNVCETHTTQKHGRKPVTH